MKLNEYQIKGSFKNDKVFVLASDEEGHKSVLLKSMDTGMSQRLKTDHMILKTNVDMLDDCSRHMGKYHVIQCISQDIDVNNQFVRVCSYMFNAITNPVDTPFISGLFQDIQTLFETTADSDSHGLQVGIYGEMCLIKYLYSIGREDVANKWHSDFYSKHDIEIDSNHRIEIKTTSGEKRIHSFRHNQLVSRNIDIVIASVIVEECEQGKSLYDLLIEIQELFDDVKKKLLIEKLIRRCKLSGENVGIICDEQHIFDNIRFYNADDVPHLIGEIPVGVSNVSYDVNLDAELPEILVSDIL